MVVVFWGIKCEKKNTGGKCERKRRKMERSKKNLN
jgi:hypothetical protein